MAISVWPYILIALYQNDKVLYFQFIYGTFHVTSATVDVTSITLDVTAVTGSFVFLCNAITLSAISNIVFVTIYAYSHRVIVGSYIF